jgi:hypothetical protein
MSDLLEKSLVDLARFAQVPLTRDPFEFLVVPGFLPHSAAQAVADSFPGPDMPGVLPVPKTAADNPFARLLAELRSPAVSRAFGEKFGLHLEPDSLMITMRARTRPIDGQIHTDSETKVVTTLIYLNTDWESASGRLRLLRGPNDLDDMIAEVPPMAGTLLAFRRSDNSWHGHKPFEGVRRSIMLNWMIDPATARWEERRHELSAGFKRLFGGTGR